MSIYGRRLTIIRANPRYAWNNKSELVSWGSLVSGGYPICSFRQFLARMCRFATIQNVTDRQTTTTTTTTTDDIGYQRRPYGRPKIYAVGLLILRAKPNSIARRDISNSQVDTECYFVSANCSIEVLSYSYYVYSGMDQPVIHDFTTVILGVVREKLREIM